MRACQARSTVFAGIFLLCAVSTGDAQQALTWEMCLEEARARHPDLVSAREGVNMAQDDKRITRSAALPQVSANSGGSTGKTEGSEQSESYSYGVSGRQLLFDGAKTSHDLAAREEGIKSAGYNYQVVSSNVRYRLRIAFVGLLSAQENVKVVQNILERRRQNRELVALQYEGGRAHKGSLLTAEAHEADAGRDLVEARRSLQLYQRRLAKELGRDRFEAMTATGDLAVTGADNDPPVFDELVEITPLLKDLVSQKEAARLGVKSARADLMPQVYAEGSAGRDDPSWPPQTGSWSAGIRVSLPIFQGGQKQAAFSRAQAGYRQAQADEKSGRDSVIMTLAETWTQWQNDVDQEGVQQKFFQAARQRADIVGAQYRSGLATFNDWTLIEDDLVRNQKALLQAKTNALLSEARWLQAKGETVDE